MATKVAKIAKVHSFTVNDFNPDILVPIDERDEDERPFNTVITTSQGWRWEVERTSLCRLQPNKRLTFSVKIKYLDGPNKGKEREGIITDFNPTGRYGKIQKK